MIRLFVIIISLIATTTWGSVGEITVITGPGEIKRQSEKFEGSAGTELEMQDAITTQNGAWQLEFLDDTRVDITEHSRMVIDEFIYDPQTKTGALSMKATLGAVRYASGQIAKNSRQRVNIRTPSATIAVRGTDFMMIVDEIGGSMVTLLPSCDISGACVVGEIEVESDAGTVIMNQAYQTTVVAHAGAIPAKPVTLDLPEDMLNSMLIVRKVSPYTEEIERQYPVTNLLDIDFLKFDELDKDPLIESIKNIWVTDLDNTTYLDEEFYDAMARQLAEILAQWFDELTIQNAAFFEEKFFGLDPETNIFYDEEYPYYLLSRAEGDQHFFRLRLGQGYSYSVDMTQGGFYTYGYLVGVGGDNSITINQHDY